MYRELKGICRTCLGCNKLELEEFEGVYSCPNELSPQDKIKQILGTKEGKQIKMEG